MTTKLTEQIDKTYKAKKQLNEAIDLIEYFVKRVEEGSIKSKTTYTKYKNFLNKLKKEENE